MGISEGLKRGVIDLIILTLLDDEDMYGYELCQTLDQRSDNLFHLQEGSLYPSLYRMLDRGYITDRKELVGKRRTRVYYHLEPLGRAYLEEIKKEYLSLNKGVLLVLGIKNMGDFLNACEKWY